MMTNRAKTARRDSIETIMEPALEPGYFIGWKNMSEFISGLEEVQRQIAGVVEKDAEQAARLYETFIACCHEKAEEVDDSDGDLGMFLDDLVRGWVLARQAADADPRETVRSLLAWAETDEFGFGEGAQQAAIKVLDRKGLAVFAEDVRVRFDAARSRRSSELLDESAGHSGLGHLLKSILAAKRDVAAYISLCEETELLSGDCRVVAEILRSRRKYEQALEWVERGLEVAKTSRWSDSKDHGLDKLRRALLARLGRPQEALTSAWTHFESYPSTFSYDELMKYVSRADRPAWHEKAMGASEQASLRTVIELWLHTKESDRLVARLRSTPPRKLEALSHYTTEPAAKKLARSHPDVGAKLHRALGMRIVNAGKSGYYGAALSHLEEARRCYAKAGLSSTWDRLVTQVRKKHSRKSSFMPGFERIAKGRKLPEEPSLLERARRRRDRWQG